MAVRKLSVAMNLHRETVSQQATRWAGEHLASSLCTGEPQFVLTENSWRVPVLLAYPFMVVGEVGELWIDGITGHVLRHTGLQKMKAAAKRLGKQHHAEIEAAFLQARDA